jgi:predicted dehydrogenase
MPQSQQPDRHRRRRLRVGVIGTGFGSRVVAGAFSEAGCDVVDVVTARDPSLVRSLCRSHVDLVAVHSPPFLHAEHVAWALDAGRAVLCEKPFGTSVDEAIAMTDAARSAGVANFLNFEFRCQPARLAMADLLASGDIGSPEHLSYSAFTSGSRIPLRPWGWLFDRSRGGGWIGAFGSHAIDLIRWLLGDVARAGAVTWVNITERPDADGTAHRCDAEDAFNGWTELRSGATASVDSSFTAGVSLTPRIVVTGTHGAIENTGDRRVVLRRRDGDTESLEFEPRSGDPHMEAMTAWAAAIRDAIVSGEPLAPSFADGLACMRVMDQWRAVPPHAGSQLSERPAVPGPRP